MSDLSELDIASLKEYFTNFNEFLRTSIITRLSMPEFQEYTQSPPPDDTETKQEQTVHIDLTSDHESDFPDTDDTGDTQNIQEPSVDECKVEDTNEPEFDAEDVPCQERACSTPATNVAESGTAGMITMNRRGWFLHPSQEVIQTRMELMYPDFRPIVGLNDVSTATNDNPPQSTDTERTSHIKEIWRIVTAVDKDLSAKMLSSSSNVKIEVTKSSSLGVRINCLVQLYETTANPSVAGPAVGNTASQSYGLPSHEEMMAYLILTPRYEFPDCIVSVLRGTMFEFLLQPLPPPEPTQSAEPDEPVTTLCRTRSESVNDKGRIFLLEHKLKLAQKEIKYHKNNLRVLQEEAREEGAAEAVKRREEICEDAVKQLEESQAKCADIDDMIMFIEKSMDEAREQHLQSRASFRKFQAQVEVWRTEGKLFGEEDLEEEDTDRDSDEGSDDDDEEDVRPSKMRRIT